MKSSVNKNFVGMKNRGSMDPVQRGGPWTWGSDFEMEFVCQRDAYSSFHGK